MRLTVRNKRWLIKHLVFILLCAAIVLTPTSAASAPTEPKPLPVSQGDYIYPQKPPDGVLCNCFNLVRQTYPNAPSADTIWNNVTNVPAGIVVIDENGQRHFAVFIANGMGEFSYHEWGKFQGKCVDRVRTMKYNSPKLRGFYLP